MKRKVATIFYSCAYQKTLPIGEPVSTSQFWLFVNGITFLRYIYNFGSC